MNRHVTGGLIITLSMVIFSFIGPFVRNVALPPPAIIFHTNRCALLAAALYLLCTGRMRQLLISDHAAWMLLSGLLMLGNTYSYYKAYSLTTLANAVLTHYIAPIFAAALAPLLLREKLEALTVVSLLISMTGLVLIAYQGVAIGLQHLAGIVYGALSGFFYGLLIVVSKRLTERFKPLTIICYQSAVALACLGPLLPRLGYTMTAQCLVGLAGYALAVCLGAGLLYLTGLRYVEAQHAGILAYAEPVLVIIIGIVLYDEVPTFRIIIGGLLIACSGYLILRAEARRA